ncbi:hypothetical protein Ctob_007072 [Chrysochromulina tobinii]|uniref:Uncharacterized protein n=1 Tax=Chrysochromulina tobinii TaxID=1460289 RepID=A0A0M0JDN0_9EUKA|nr:hypothetical protein Ctob_007072 [Chrysochromulina tobinii]|eukprot:KOO24575.1 hypothetical protein Ctob_007072 [Chrysochromulina sp. CCMP291]
MIDAFTTSFTTTSPSTYDNGGASAAANAAKAGLRSGRGGLLESEARMILNVKPTATEAEVLEAHKRLIEMNDPSKGGSKYLQQKVSNACDVLLVDRGGSSSSSAGAGASGKQ